MQSGSTYRAVAASLSFRILRILLLSFFGAAAILGGRYGYELRMEKLEAEYGGRGQRAFSRPGRNAPYIQSVDAVVSKMIQIGSIQPDDLVYDLGCGDGRLVIAAAVKYGCHGIGFDIEESRVAEARENVKQAGVEHLVEIRQQDIFTVDLKDADVVLMYLLPWMNRKLIPQFAAMQPGSRIVSHDFGLGDIVDLPSDKTEQVVVEQDESIHLIHMWKTPLKIR